MKKPAFTLAEVLLTLTIIGVVAALTVPNLMGAVEDKELAAQAQKAYNTLQNAIDMKYSLTRLTPADVPENEIFSKFLAGDEAPTLKYIEKHGNAVKLPDGQVMAARTGSKGCDKVQTPSYGCWIQVDVNGEDGPTFSYVGGEGNVKNAAGMVMTNHTYTYLRENGNLTYDRRYRDMVFFNIDGLTVTPYTKHGVTARYFKGIK